MATLADRLVPGAVDRIAVPIAPGREGVRQKLALMRGLIDLDRDHPKVRALACRILRRAGADDPRDHRARLAALLDWTHRRILYVAENRETMTRAGRVLGLAGEDWRFEDCDGMTIGFACLAESIGYPTNLEAVGWGGSFRHVATLVGTPPGNGPRGVREWIPAESTLPVPLGWDYLARARERDERGRAELAPVAGLGALGIGVDVNLPGPGDLFRTLALPVIGLSALATLTGLLVIRVSR